MDGSTVTAGTSLVSGIQDISAFLPIIGTEQCEKHVGEALNGGFLYAAATPLSLFGCLGIVKASAAILCASVSPRLAQMLADAGFKLEGSIAAMIGAKPQASPWTGGGLTATVAPWLAQILADAGFKLEGSIATIIEKKLQASSTWAGRGGTAPNGAKKNAKEDVQYTAGQTLLDLLQKQHISPSQVKPEYHYHEWNFWLCISTFLLSCLSITPYIRIIMEDHHPSNSMSTWIYPLIRIFGSAISVVVAQMIIQIRVQQIVQMTLDGSRRSTVPLQQVSPNDYISKATLPDEDQRNKITTAAAAPGQLQNIQDGASEITVPAQQSSTRRVPLHDEETGIRIAVPTNSLSEDNSPTQSPLSLLALQIVLSISIGCTAVGYLGCFTVVQRATTTNTYIWLAVEVALAILRICIWGLNPSWDEDTNLRLMLKLQNKAPIVTAVQDYKHCIAHAHQPFLILSDGRFLDYISPYTGPAERFSDPGHHIAIYYALASSSEDTFLLTVVLDLESRSTFVLEHRCPCNSATTSGSTVSPKVYSATLQDTGIMMANAKYNTVLYENHEFRETKRFNLINEHSREIANRIGGQDRIGGLRLSWGMDRRGEKRGEITESNSEQVETPLTCELVKRYAELQKIAGQWRDDFYRERDLQIVECMAEFLIYEPAAHRNPQQTIDRFTEFGVAMESLLVYESLRFDTLLREKTAPGSETTKEVFYTYAQKLEVRSAHNSRNEASTKRIVKYEEMLTKILPYRGSESRSDFIHHVDDLRAKLRKVAEPSGRLNGDDSEDPEFNCDGSFQDVSRRIWMREREQVQKRLGMWEKSTSLNPCLAHAIFAAYPACAHDAELIKVMVDRGCTVFDLSNLRNDQLPAVISHIKNVPGVSLLQCSAHWLPQLTKIAQSNPNILQISFSEVVSSSLLTTLQANRHDWGSTTSIPHGDDAVSWFCFPDQSRCSASGISISINDVHAKGVLFIKTAQGGKFRVDFWHRINERQIKINWTLHTTPVSNTTTIRVKRTTVDFQRDNFAVQVPSAGVHEITIDFDTCGPGYELRRVGVSREDAVIHESSHGGSEAD